MGGREGGGGRPSGPQEVVGINPVFVPLFGEPKTFTIEARTKSTKIEAETKFTKIEFTKIEFTKIEFTKIEFTKIEFTNIPSFTR
jgi:hypothetical protein